MRGSQAQEQGITMGQPKSCTAEKAAEELRVGE